MTFVPDIGVPVADFVWNPLETFVPDPKFVVVPQCTRTEVPEGLWTACSDGYSHLQRQDAAETLASRARVQSLKTMATVRRTLRGLADIVLKTGDTKCRALGIEVRAYVESWYPEPPTESGPSTARQSRANFSRKSSSNASTTN